MINPQVLNWKRGGLYGVEWNNTRLTMPRGETPSTIRPKTFGKPPRYSIVVIVAIFVVTFVYLVTVVIVAIVVVLFPTSTAWLRCHSTEAVVASVINVMAVIPVCVFFAVNLSVNSH